MKYLIIHNRYSRIGGEESVVSFQCSLLRHAGHEVVLYERDYNEIKHWRFGRLSSFFSSFYNRRSVSDIKSIIKDYNPDVAIVHNLYPVISPAILPLLRLSGVRVLMTVHNFRLICPTGLFFSHGNLCEKCGRGMREFNCLWNCCEGSITGSLAFALRNYWSRLGGYYLQNVDKFLVQSEFHLEKLFLYGVPRDKMAVVPNCLDLSTMPDGMSQDGGYVAFVGRLSAEKGVDLLFDVARLLPDVRFCVAGETAAGYSLSCVPANIEFRGFMNREQLADFYCGSSLLIHTSRVYEGLPLSVLEAMSYSRAVVAQNIAALPEVLDYGRCGLLASYGSSEELAFCVSQLLQDKEMRDKLGSNGHERVTQYYNSGRYLEALDEYSTCPKSRVSSY